MSKWRDYNFITLGAVFTVFSEEHAEFEGVKVEGPFKGEHCRYQSKVSACTLDGYFQYWPRCGAATDANDPEGAKKSAELLHVVLIDRTSVLSSGEERVLRCIAFCRSVVSKRS